MSCEDPLSQALALLFRAYSYARDLGVDVWDFAVDWDEFRSANISKSELRWLLRQGLVQQADELISVTVRKRRFRLISSTAITGESCFIITEAGAAHFKDFCTGRPGIEASRMRSDCQFEGVLRAGLHEVALGHNGIPHWNCNRRELSFNGQLVKRFRTPAPNQFIILEAFESSAWPARIDDPLPAKTDQCPKRRLHDAIKCLNRHQSHASLRFGGDGSGCGILWDPAD
jgi:hypothetical protein